MNRINKVFEKDGAIMSIYFTAGFPKKNDTLSIIKELDSAGVEMIEIGLPFSDPLADGPTIQKSSTVALNNGMNTSLLFEQLKDLRKITDVPVIIMGYFNPILQFGIKKFLSDELLSSEFLLNLASNEYFSAIDKSKINSEIISPIFKDFKNGKLKIISFYAKKARGMMVRYVADHLIDSYDNLLSFNYGGYIFNENETTVRNQPVFTR